MLLLLLFIAVPLIEIALFIQVGGWLGLWPTLAIVLVTAVLGTVLVRQQGLSVLRTLSTRINSLQDPTEPLAHGAMILFSGALLLTPGFFTDAVGFALLVPGVRVAVFKALRSRIKVQGVHMGGAANAHPGFNEGHPNAQPRPNDPEDVIIEADYTDLDQPKGPSGWTRKDQGD